MGLTLSAYVPFVVGSFSVATSSDFYSLFVIRKNFSEPGCNLCWTCENSISHYYFDVRRKFQWHPRALLLFHLFDLNHILHLRKPIHHLLPVKHSFSLFQVFDYYLHHSTLRYLMYQYTKSYWRNSWILIQWNQTIWYLHDNSITAGCMMLGWTKLITD